jgi:ribosomal protein L37AE/L43A
LKWICLKLDYHSILLILLKKNVDVENLHKEKLFCNYCNTTFKEKNGIESDMFNYFCCKDCRIKIKKEGWFMPKSVVEKIRDDPF